MVWVGEEKQCSLYKGLNGGEPPEFFSFLCSFLNPRRYRGNSRQSTVRLLSAMEPYLWAHFPNYKLKLIPSLFSGWLRFKWNIWESSLSKWKSSQKPFYVCPLDQIKAKLVLQYFSSPHITLRMPFKNCPHVCVKEGFFLSFFFLMWLDYSWFTMLC